VRRRVGALMRIGQRQILILSRPKLALGRPICEGEGS
jgi:hypothetical protein